MANHDFECLKGSRAKVMNGTCRETTGGLKKKDLKYNDNGKIVSKRASEKAKLNKNLGVFQKKKGSSGFALIPKRGSAAYKKMKETKSSKKGSQKKRSSKKKRCPNGSRKSKSGKSCMKKK